MLTQSMASSIGTVVTFTVDHLVYSQNPPVVFAVVDFNNGGRIPIEITDVAENEVEIGMNVEPTFRKLFTADGLHNYFWKVRPIRSHKGITMASNGIKDKVAIISMVAPRSKNIGTKALTIY